MVYQRMNTVFAELCEEGNEESGTKTRFRGVRTTSRWASCLAKNVTFHIKSSNRKSRVGQASQTYVELWL